MRIVTACVGIVLLALAGCSGDPSKGIVQGQATYQGEPIAEGQIVFTLEDNSASEGGIIQNGQFESAAPVGPCTVRITARRKKILSRPPPGMPGEEWFTTEAYVPAKYNEKSTLTLEVAPGGQEHDFHLE